MNNEFRINRYIILKLENEEMVIYVNGVKFYQCKYLLIDIPKNEIPSYSEINSIDELVMRETNIHFKKLEFPPKSSFGGIARIFKRFKKGLITDDDEQMWKLYDELVRSEIMGTTKQLKGRWKECFS